MVDVNVDFIFENEQPVNADFQLEPDVTYTADILLSSASSFHNELYNRDLPDQHPMSAITGLEDALEGLSDDITAENNRAIEAEEALDNKIDSEADTRADEITRVEGLISAEENRAKGVEQQLANSIDSLGQNKVDKVSTANRVYGTDSQGNQTTYDKGSFGQVDDVRVDGVSVVTNKIANLGSMASEDADNYPTLAGDNIFTGTETINQGRDGGQAVIDINRGDIVMTHTPAGESLPTGVGFYNSFSLSVSEYPTSGESFDFSANNGGTNANYNDTDGNQTSFNVGAGSIDASIYGNDIDVYAYMNDSGVYVSTPTGSDDEEVVNVGYANTNYAGKGYETTITSHIADRNNPHNVTKAQVGLGDVENIAPADMPMSTATKTYVDNADNGLQGQITTINTTIGGYGNIVTHNVSEFATASQGALADTSLQSSDNISELTNNLNYQTATQVANSIAVETNNRESADNGLQSQIDAIVSASDVFDIVGTYAELQAYDISTVPVNDIIKVLVDSTHSGAATYYRCVENNNVKSWSYIGSEGAYYTKAEADSNFVPQTRTVNNKALSSDITLTASDVGALPSSTVIPTVNNGQLDIQVNGSSIATFTANQSGNTTANVVVPDSATWGNITGTLSNQTDLQTALNGKYDASNPNGYITGINSSDVTTALGYTPADQTHLVNGAPISNSSQYYYGTSSTAAATVQKEVTISGITELNAGQVIVVKPTVTSTVANSTLKLNNFSAYPMRYNNANITTSTDSVVWNANYPTIWLFDGDYWVFLGHGVDSNTTYSVMSVAEGVAGTVTSSRVLRSDYLKEIIETLAPAEVIDQTYSSTSTNAQSGTAVAEAISTKYDSSNPAGYVTSSALTPYALSSSLSTVATSGNYADLSGKPNYGAGLSYSSSSLQLLDQNGNNLGTAVTIKSTPDLDGVTIDTNSDDELEAIGVIEKNTGAVKYDWIGTLAEYNAQNVETLHPEWVCYITDDVSGGTSVYTKIETDSAISNALDNVYTKSAVDTLISGLLANTTSTVTSNYIRLGDWLVHWGISSTMNVPASAFASQQITLSPAFANSGYTVILNHIDAGGGYANVVPQANTRTPNSFEIYCWGQGGAGITNIAWIAIGKGA